MAYSFSGRVRYSEIGENGLLNFAWDTELFSGLQYFPFRGSRAWGKGSEGKKINSGYFLHGR